MSVLWDWLQIAVVLAEHILSVISHQINILEKECYHVLSVSDYAGGEPSLLSFPAHAVIKLTETEDQDHKKGWLHGAYKGCQGCFPAEYAAPILSCSGEEPPSREAIHRAKVKASPDGHVAASTMVTDSSSSIVREKRSKRKKEPKGRRDKRKSTLPSLHVGKITWQEFAREHLLHGSKRVERTKLVHTRASERKGLLGSLRQTLLGGGGDKLQVEDIEDLVSFSERPIVISLLPLDTDDLELNTQAVDCFHNIMRFMGDYFLSKGTTQEDCLLSILQCGQDHKELCDEIFCQLIKQTTNNNSTKEDSCLRGWQILIFCTIFFSCSPLFLPPLIYHLQLHSSDSSDPYHNEAAICELNVSKVLKYGGRKELPSPMEITAAMAGRNIRRQVVYLPGGEERVVRVRISTTISDLLHELCSELELTNKSDETLEFGMHALPGDHALPILLEPSGYVLDTIAMLQEHVLGAAVKLYFSKHMWYHPLEQGSDLHTDLLYHQANVEVLKGHLVRIHTGGLSKETKERVSQLAALQYRVDNTQDSKDEISLKEIADIIPRGACSKVCSSREWLELVQQQWQTMACKLSPYDAKRKYIKIVSKFSLYGSRFFSSVKSVSGDKVTDPVMMAVNKNGVYLLDHLTKKEVLKLTYDKIVSTRFIRSQSGLVYLDIRHGTLMSHTLLRYQTLHGQEIASLITNYQRLGGTRRRRQSSTRETY